MLHDFYRAHVGLVDGCFDSSCVPFLFFSRDVIEVIMDCECIGPGDVFTLFLFA